MEPLLVEQDGSVLRLTLNRPQARNALNLAMMDSLHESLRRANRDPDVRCVLISGNGPVFSAGGDLKELATGAEPLRIRHILNNHFRPVVRLLLTLDKPVITALNGPAAGAATSLLMASDQVIATPRASFIPAFLKIAGVPDNAMAFLLAQNVGLIRAKDIIMRNRTLSAAEALEAGLYTEVVAEEEFAATMMQRVTEFADGPTITHGLVRNALREASHMGFEAFMDLEGVSQSVLHTTQDHKEGIQAFIDKREPHFRGT